MSVDFKEFNRKMDKTLEVLQENFGAIRAGRANARVLDRITVEYYGVETPVGHVGSISSPDACSRRSKRPSRPPSWASTRRTTAA